MQTVTSNTTQQINAALFALDKSIKELDTAINVIEKALKENDATLLEKINEKVNKADVVDAVTDGDLNPVTSNAVYDGLSEKVNTSDVVDRIEVSNSKPVTSNSVANALSISGEEKQVGYYFGDKMYARTFVYYNVPSQANTATLLDSNFPIPLNNIDRLEVVRVGWSNVVMSGCQIYLVDNSLYFLQGVTNSTFGYVIVTAYYN